MPLLQPNTEFKAAHGVYKVRQFLGKGKSGHVYLIENEDGFKVLKVIHDEEVPYYHVADKMGAELEWYKRLRNTSIKIPVMHEYDLERKYLIKDFLCGTVGSEAVAASRVSDRVFSQLFSYAMELETGNINIDYFPANFLITTSEDLYYVDYEANPYSEEWNLLNWGIYYWVNNQGMKKFLKTKDASHINSSVERGIPVKDGLGPKVAELKAKFWH
ncbi:MAG: hypothetical protein GX410_03840 [Elusimicrobia bacterium]|nr:hypothetical protein [Elusimicrobiota bacterium]